CLLRDGGGQERLCLRDLIVALHLLHLERGLTRFDLDRVFERTVRVVGAVGGELAGDESRNELSRCDRIALRDEELPDLSADLRTHDDVIGRYDAREHEVVRPGVDHPRDDREEENRSGDEREALAFHGVKYNKRAYETPVLVRAALVCPRVFVMCNDAL